MRRLFGIAIGVVLVAFVSACSNLNDSNPSDKIVNRYIEKASSLYGIDMEGLAVSGESHSLHINVSSKKKLNITEARVFMLQNLSILQDSVDTVEQKELKKWYGWDSKSLSKIAFTITFMNDDKTRKDEDPLERIFFVDTPGLISAVRWWNKEIEYCVYRRRPSGYFGFDVIHRETLEEAKKLATEDGFTVPANL